MKINQISKIFFIVFGKKIHYIFNLMNKMNMLFFFYFWRVPFFSKHYWDSSQKTQN